METLYRFRTDYDLSAHPDLGELVEEDPPFNVLRTTGFLGGSTEPYYRGGLRIVAECPEFRLLQRRGPGERLEVELSFEVARRYYKSAMGISNASSASTPEQRLNLAIAIHGLVNFTEANREALGLVLHPENLSSEAITKATPNGSTGGTAVSLGCTLGAALLAVKESADPDQAVKDLVGALNVGIRAWARFEKLLPESRESTRPIAQDAIEAAMVLYKISEGERPSKSEVKKLLVKAFDKDFAGKNVRADWTDLFIVAGLGDLPD